MNTNYRQHRESDLAPTSRLFNKRLFDEEHVVTWSLAAVSVAIVMMCILGCGGSRIPPPDAQSTELASAQASSAAEKTQLSQPTTKKLKKYPNEDYNASIVQILAHRDHYHGKKVRIEGYLVVEFEGTAIYLSKDDADYLITRNSFAVSFDERAVPYKGNAGPTQFDRKYVLIEGTFDKDNMGHMSLSQGSIKGVTRVMELRRNLRNRGPPGG